MTVIKKYYLVLALLIFSMIPSIAGGIGYINYEKVFDNYAYAKTTLHEIDARAKEIEQYLIKKEDEYNKLESPIQKKKFESVVQEEMKIKQDAFNKFREEKEESVFTKIHAVTEKIRLEKGFDAILDARSVFSGGTDITDILIQKLNSNIR